MVTKMKKTVMFFAFSILAMLGGCGNAPAPQHFIGTWIGPDGAQVILNADNSFSARALPSKIFGNPTQASAPISGSGHWKITGNWRTYWEVALTFNEESGKPSRLGVHINISGSGASVGLYQWVDEEGGSRYELIKK